MTYAITRIQLILVIISLCFISPVVCAGVNVDNESTTVLIHANASIGSYLIDEAGGVWTLSGTGDINTTQKKFGNASMFQGVVGSGAITTAFPDSGRTLETVDLWIYPISFSNNPGIIAGGDGPSNGYIQFATSGIPTYYAPGNQAKCNFGIISKDTWTHIALQTNGTYASCYTNGVLIGSTASALPLTNSSTMHVGGYPSNQLRGYVDEIRFSSIAVYGDKSYFTPPIGEYGIRVATTFLQNVTSGEPILAVNFTDTSIGNPTQWVWNATEIGNNTPITFSNLQNPVYNFTVGNYSIRLNASNSMSFNISTRASWVNVTTDLNASFSGSPVIGAVPFQVYFTDASAGSPTSWLWDFGDGNTTDNTLQNPTHLYSTEGSYYVNLTVTDAYLSRSRNSSDYIKSYAPPTCQISMFNNAGSAPFTTYLYDTSFNLTPGPATYYWMLGDGNTSTAQNLYFTWNTSGTYSLNHSVSNGVSTGWKNLSEYVVVGAPVPVVVAPVASFYGGPQTGAPPLAVYFTDASANTPTSWNWSFGDNTFAVTQNPSHTYNTSGFFRVNLTATNTAGSNTTSQSNFIMVY